MLAYQDDFVMPGSSPRKAMERIVMRDTPNVRR